MIMERKIGEIFEYNGEWYQCVGGTCRNCSFYDNTVCKNITPLGSTNFGNCHCYLRTDHKSVIFKKLEKVGESYTFVDKTVQNYLLETEMSASPEDVFILTNNELRLIAIEIKQNKEDMEEKKDNYDGNMDEECIPICDALNSIPDVYTNESCCGHCKDRFMIFLTCNNSHSLALIARVFDRRYIGASQPWHIELQTKDSGSYDYFIHSETKYSSKKIMMKDVNKIIENIKYWGDDKFACYFKGSDDTKHSNSEKIGKNLKPFSLEAAKAGKPVCTRDGRKARIICFDLQSIKKTPIVAAVQVADKQEIITNYYEDGRQFIDGISDLDLMMLSEKKEGWINVYKELCYETKEEAIRHIAPGTHYIDTIRVEWEDKE